VIHPVTSAETSPKCPVFTDGQKYRKSERRGQFAQTRVLKRQPLLTFRCCDLGISDWCAPCYGWFWPSQAGHLPSRPTRGGLPVVMACQWPRPLTDTRGGGQEWPPTPPVPASPTLTALPLVGRRLSVHVTCLSMSLVCPPVVPSAFSHC
jgi:hypothetical protein